MNRFLTTLRPYPFERLNRLLTDVVPADKPPVPLSLGEPKHPAPDFLIDMLADDAFLRIGVGTYPPTKGLPELRQAISSFASRRYGLAHAPDPDTQVLPVNGTREALFAFAQVVIDNTSPSLTLIPNPFYQIYEGAVLLAGSEPRFVNCTEATGHCPPLSDIDSDTWRQCQLIYICNPGNPSGAVMDLSSLQDLIALSDEYDFVIASDECYSEIYSDDSEPPPGLLQAADAMGRSDYKNCVVFNSLSKRSSLPGLRSGFVCGDARYIEQFLLYRTYHGSAMSVHNQHVSAAAWSDEAHVVANRTEYRKKYDAVLKVLSKHWPQSQPAGGFYLWPETPIDDLRFTQQLLKQQNVKVVPGQYLARDTPQGNPGQNRVRLALVATMGECVEAAERIVSFIAAGKFE